MTSDSRPNVLFIITDQQRADHTGFMGNTVVRTPNIDAIAERGVVFENAWVSNPVCMPNRCTMLTGRMPTAHGVIFNDRSLAWGTNTIARQFKEAGYATALIGKSHLQHGTSRNSIVPYRGQPSADDPSPTGWDEIENYERYVDGAPHDPEDFYGFGHVNFTLDHGARVTGHHYRWALEKGAKSVDILTEYNLNAPGQYRSDHWWQIYQPPYESDIHSTTYVTEQTIEFVEKAAQKDEPWFAWVSFPDPHHPMTPPGEWFFRHHPEDMVLPETRFDSLEDAPEHLRLFRNTHPQDQRDWVTPCGYGEDELLREATAATYGAIEMIDDGIGRILACLENVMLSDNTIIVFTSDHGDMMGDHGLFLKGFMHYRGTLQVPMIISAPGLPSARSKSLASSIDLGPTLLDLCSLDGFDGIQGQSLVPVLQDSHASVRDHVLIEDDLPPLISDFVPIPAKTRTLITESHRYTRNSKGEEQLFDLTEDPGEMTDIKSSEPQTRAELIERLADALIAADDASRGAPHV